MWHYILQPFLSSWTSDLARNLFRGWQARSKIHFDVVLLSYGCSANGVSYLEFHTKTWYAILARTCNYACKTHHSLSQNTPLLGSRCEEPHYAFPSIAPVGIATRYGLDGPGIECRWGARFSAPVQTGPGAHPASSTMGTGSFPGVKRPGRGADHPPSS